MIECAATLQLGDKLRRCPRIIITADINCAIKRSRGADTTYKQILVRNIAAILVFLQGASCAIYGFSQTNISENAEI
ncbi:hypothetical protein SEEN554_07025 [Salmonella enterica subsp. enterica serovar Newport str. CVM 21554]|nr:hypothetical protein SEEN554_07025 [Salmonella enterica subsp. enterica serovar Newport str. CVM 21554]